MQASTVRKLTQKRARHFSRVLAIGVSAMMIALALASAGWRASQLLGGTQLRAASLAGGTVVVVVQPGDTLWQLAIEHGPRWQDPRLTVAAIRELNALPGADLRPGMAIRVPTDAPKQP